MKKIVVVSLFAFGLFFSSTAKAQEEEGSVKKEIKRGAKDLKEGVEEAGHDIKKGAEKVGNKTAELASKGKAKVTDEVYEDKVGPKGQTIYIDEYSKYYWIDRKGRKHYVKSSDLQDKKE